MEINKDRVRHQFRRSMPSYDENAKVQKIVAQHLCVMVVEELFRVPRKILEVGCGTGLLTSRLRQLFPDSELFVNDLVEDMNHITATMNQITKRHCLPGDIEQVELPGKFDLIVSASTFQWLTHPDATFRKLADHLTEDGCMVFSTFGKHNLREIRLTTGGGLKYRTKDEICELLYPYFNVEQVKEEFYILDFDSPMDILQHLKKTGVNVSNDLSVWTKGRVNAFIDDYNARFAMNGRVPLTYHPLYFVCRKKAIEN